MATLGLPGVQKVNGAAYPGVWVEKQVTFIKISFSADISAIPEADLLVLGTATPVVSANTGTVADGTFGVVNSVLVQALQVLELDATVLGISAYNAAARSVDVMLGYADGWVAQTNAGLITATATTGYTVQAANAIVTTAGTAPTNAPLGTVVSVVPGTFTFGLEFVYMNGTMPVATVANGALEAWTDGNGPGTQAAPMGAPGWYPVDPYTA